MKAKESINKALISALALTLLAILAPPASAQIAPDATDVGPLDTTSAEYKFNAVLDTDISGLPTELWARVYRPVDLSGAFPLLVFLHGNHGTCGHGTNPRVDDSTQYTFYGTCPPGYVVTPNHLGYTYLADRLASWGYIVVSINANRGINGAPGPTDDVGVNLVRGRLLLRHLQRLSEWNTFGGTPDSLGVDLQGKLDFSQVGLFGHSRGGEGVRAAYNQYRDPDSPWPGRIPDPVNFVAIFEIGPVDGQTSRLLDADGTVWNVLLPMCDGDVSNLQGIRAFDRNITHADEVPATQKSTFTVWGANHNFYNTEWQQSDSTGCSGPDNNPLFTMPVGSPEQRQTGLASVMAFFRGNVGNANATFNENFNPQFQLPPVVTTVTRVDRGFTDSPNATVNTVFEDFDKPTGTNTYGFPNDASNITIAHSAVQNHNTVDPYFRAGTQRAGAISWTTSGPDTFFQTNWAAAGTGKDISNFLTLDLRVSRQCAALPPASCSQPNALNPAGPTNFSIQLVQADGTMSDAVQLSSYTDLRGPVGSPPPALLHPILQTARISLSDFGDIDLTQIHGVRLTFDGAATGAVFVANIRLSTMSGLVPGNNFSLDSLEASGVTPPANNQNITEGNTLRMRSVAAASQLANAAGVEIAVTSDTPFPVRDELAILRIGEQAIAVSRYPDTGDTHTLIFTLTVEQFASANDGDQVWVQYGMSDASLRWSFGPLNKAAVNQ